ncbi:MAPEG family protein [Shewanella schlegeliana]|uniref:MAPEG family protein n=1 Tax=Shewanella schlegeliana TaxID=190308 RepID=A0ABS1T2W2_9GAMM|nr:MAPEG family protein [Shewanella schlegeliana]MBL4915024.1 MAPEG family protein [Shewanella schlegeliana]MCL1110564.1 MAPEG family protein [Shewanella schlegeliana]GIU32301.1 glutathione S-transferase [Shewanella schlegeliana]
MSLLISGLYVSLSALIMVVLAYRVIKLRRLHKIGIGSAGNDALLLAQRVHANFLENAPITLLLLVLAEANGTKASVLHLFGTVWLVSRLMHAIGLTLGRGGYHFARFWGVLMTWAVIIGLVAINLFAFVAHL